MTTDMEVGDLFPCGDEYDWKEAFGVACRDSIGPAPPGAIVSTTAFTVYDVEAVLHAREGQNDEADWCCVVLLQDGRYACVRAGCDYTGWG